MKTCPDRQNKFKMLPNKKKARKNGKKCFECCLSGEILSNLVTLAWGGHTTGTRWRAQARRGPPAACPRSNDVTFASRLTDWRHSAGRNDKARRLACSLAGLLGCKRVSEWAMACPQNRKAKKHKSWLMCLSKMLFDSRYVIINKLVLLRCDQSLCKSLSTYFVGDIMTS